MKLCNDYKEDVGLTDIILSVLVVLIIITILSYCIG